VLGSWANPIHGSETASIIETRSVHPATTEEGEDSLVSTSEAVDKMAVTDYNQRPASYAMTALEDRFEVIKEVGDGSFGSVALARVRANGSSVARRNSMVRFTDQCSQGPLANDHRLLSKP
jgi:hypothetical protein